MSARQASSRDPQRARSPAPASRRGGGAAVACALGLLLAAAPAGAAAASAPGAATPTTAGPPADQLPGALVLRHGALEVRPHVRLELRAAGLTGDDSQLLRGDLAEQPGFAVPRARFGLRGQLVEHVQYLVVTDLAAGAGGGSGLLTDAWIGYDRFRYAKLWFGVRTVPFSYSAILSSADAGLSERSRAADAMAPFRQVGVTLGGDYDLAGLSWRLGVYNGFDRHLEFYRGAVGAAGLRGNRFHGLSIVGRLQLQPLGAVGDEVADLDGGGLRLSLGGGAYGNDSGAAWMTGASADLHLKWRGLHLLCEAILDRAEPVQQPTTGSTPQEPFGRQALSAELGYTRGRLGLALRAEQIDPNDAVRNADDELWLSAGLSWHFVRNLLRADLQLDHRREQAGQPFANDTLLAKLSLRY
jgi:hypothetical protein